MADPNGKISIASGDSDWIYFSAGDIASQTVFQFQKKPKKCKNLRSYGLASGSNALSYMSFVAAVITLVININNNSECHSGRLLILSYIYFRVNANNNNNNQANINFGNNNNLVSNLNQNVGNNFNLMFPPGRRRRRQVLLTDNRISSVLFRDILVYSQCKKND